MRRLASALLLLLCMASGAFASSPAPTRAPMPVVDDTADVLEAQSIADLQAFSAELLEKAGVELRIVTKHFLGGAQPSVYARELLAAQPDAADLLVLALIIGEDAYASAIGTDAAGILSADTLDTLLATHLRPPFLARDYGRALANFALRLAAHIQNATGIRIDVSGLFAAYAPAATATPAPQATVRPMQDWLDELEDIFRVPSESAGRAERYDEQTRPSEEPDGGFSLGFIPIVVIGYLLYSIFGRKKGRGGCGPLGWILGTWGASRIFRRRW